MLSQKNQKLQTPGGITGVSATEKNSVKPIRDLRFGVDWLQGSFSTKFAWKIQRYSEALLGRSEYQERPYGTRHYNRSFAHPSGAITGAGRKIPTVNFCDEENSYLEFSGSVLSRVKQRKLRKFMIFLRDKTDFHPSHIDVKIDDHSRILDLDQIERAGNKHHYLGFRNTIECEYRGRNASLGKQLSLGNRGSAGGGKRIVFYDKGLESKGKIDAIRVELNCYRHYAEQIFNNLCDLPFCAWGDVILGWISGSIDFRRRQGDHDPYPGKRRRLRWWSKFVGDSVQLTPSREYSKDSLEKIKNWFRVQVAPSVAVLINVLGKNDLQEFWEFFWVSIIEGEARFKNKHKWLINSA